MLLRVHVNDCSVEDINGKYDVCNEHFKVPIIGETKGTPKKPGKEIRPDFMFLHISNTTKYEYGLYLQSIPKLGYHKSVWVIARISHEKEPLIYYCCEQTTGNIPPESGWKAVGGHEPVPKVKIEILDNPVFKNHPPVEVNKNQLEQICFGHTSAKEGNRPHNESTGYFKHVNEEYQKKSFSKLRQDTLIQQPPCSDIRRAVNEFK